MNEAERVSYNRIIWHSRRGMLELDLVLEPFVKSAYPSLPPGQQALYRQLLDCQDQDLFNWFLKKEPVPDQGLAEMVTLILDFNRQRGKS